MSEKRTIEVDLETADALEREADARGLSLSSLLTDLASPTAPPSNFQDLRAKGRGPWSPEALAEDARGLEAFQRTGEGIPLEEVTAWIESWGTPSEMPMPKPRRL